MAKTQAAGFGLLRCGRLCGGGWWVVVHLQQKDAVRHLGAQRKPPGQGYQAGIPPAVAEEHQLKLSGCQCQGL
mgnify:CR=1 FL=1